MRHWTEARDLLRLRSPLVIAMSVSAACPPKEASRSRLRARCCIQTRPSYDPLRPKGKSRRPNGHSRAPRSDRDARVAKVSFRTMPHLNGGRPGTPPSTRTPESSSQGARTLWHAANQDLLREGYFERSELRSDFAAAPFAGCDLFGATVQISPIESVKRHSKEQYGIVTESIYAPARSRIEICYEAPAHLLVLYEDGVRREGETSIDGLSPSGLRNFANKLTFVPAGHAYREWHETGAPLRVTYLYLSPTKLQKSIDADTSYAPRTFFEDPILWATAIKL